MNSKLGEAEKQSIVEQYQRGTSVAVLCLKADIPQSTIYSWINLYCKTVTDTGRTFTPRDFDAQKKRIEKLEGIITVLKSVDCTISSPLKEKLDALESLRGNFSVYTLCQALEVPRGTFYNHIFRNKRNNTVQRKKQEESRVLIREVYDEYDQLFGAKKIQVILAERGHTGSEKIVAKLMREMGLYSIRDMAKKEYKKQLRQEKKRNVLDRQFNTDQPNQVWVSDVTYFNWNNKTYYICVIIDLYSRKIVTHRISLRNSTQLITATFKEAYTLRNPTGSLTFHSDRGVAYISYSFRGLLKSLGVTQSFSNSGQPHDNAVSESFFASMKKEKLYRTDYRSEIDFKRKVSEYIDFYNEKRPHATLRYKRPNQVEEAFFNNRN